MSIFETQTERYGQGFVRHPNTYQPEGAAMHAASPGSGRLIELFSDNAEQSAIRSAAFFAEIKRE
ncbi:MAG: hypothetical protein K9M45_12885 [Kiritimatiellales bacterium]|nr:hypothetical protein [Kiritimatiellales bacterium]